MVIDGTQVKILAWYDNEWGYANRIVELARIVAAGLAAGGCERRTRRADDRSGDLRNYALVTGAYWADTITDGAMRMLVLFYFYDRGYSPFEVASLFLFYEFFGIVTNLVGGWLAARLGLKATLLMGLGTQLVALGMLAVRALGVARRALRDGRAGALGHRQGPDQDELQERGQARRAARRARRALPLGRGPDRLEERAQGRRLLRRRPAADGRRDSSPRWPCCWCSC